MKIWYQSTLDSAQHPNYANALAAHFRKIAVSGTAVLLHGRVGDPRNHLLASEIIGSPVVYQSVVDAAFIRAVLASEEANSDALSLLPSASPFFQSYVVWQRSQWSQCRRLASSRRQRGLQVFFNI
jgi:hypothetical protein